MATVMTRSHSQHSGTRQSTKRPESPIKRGNSARRSASFRDSTRSPSPFSPNTSHNAMPSPVSTVASMDGGVLLKPASPVRRRSARLSKGPSITKASSKEPKDLKDSRDGKDAKDIKSANGTVLSAATTALTASLPNIAAVKPSPKIEELEERSIDGPITQSHAAPAAPNGHANGYDFSHHDAITPASVEKIDNIQTIDLLEEKSPAAHLAPQIHDVSANHKSREGAPVDQPKEAAKHEIDWEIPRKALHSSIGFVVIGFYAFSFTITPIVSVLFCLLVAISSLDFIRLNNPRFEAFYENAVGAFMRESEKKKINGTVWYLIGVIFVLSVYPSDIAVVSILILSWADTAASTIGRLWGRYTPPLPRRLPYIGLRFAPRKSTAGYAAAFVTGAAISSAFLGYHASRTPYAGPSPFYSPPSLEELKNMDWDQLSTLLKSMTNFYQPSVSHTPSSWSWEQRVGGGWPGLLVIGLWSGLVTAMAEAMDLGDVDDNLTLPVLSGLGVWAYAGLLRWIDQRML